jgi:N-acetylneuraminate synthase
MHGEVLLHPLAQDAPIRIDDIDSPYARNEQLKALIYSRGL